MFVILRVTHVGEVECIVFANFVSGYYTLLYTIEVCNLCCFLFVVLKSFGHFDYSPIYAFNVPSFYVLLFFINTQIWGICFLFCHKSCFEVLNLKTVPRNVSQWDTKLKMASLFLFICFNIMCC